MMKAISEDLSMTISRTYLGRSPITDGPRIPDSRDQFSGLASKMIDISKPFSEQEIKAVVWGVGADRAPRLDGFPIFFYRYF